MSKTSVKERRVHERHAINVNLQGTPDQGGVVARMVASNLSLGGLYCTSNTDFPEMTRLAVRLMLPIDHSETESEPVDLEAVVVRREQSRSSNGQPRYDFALYFTNVDPSAHDQLKRYFNHRSV